MEIELSKIVSGPHQLRSISVDEELWELAESIRQHGLLQPVKVRPVDHGYELVYGHRRVAAMRLLGWTRCETIVEGSDDANALVQSIVENLQRQSLDILDEARSYQILVERGCTLKQIAELVKKPQGRIGNRLSILRLPRQVREMVRSRQGQHETTTEHGGLSADSASRIASAVGAPEEAVALARKAVDERLNSREIRELTGRLKETVVPYDREQIIRRPWKLTERAHGGNQRDEDIRSLAGPQAAEPFSIQIHRKIVWNLHRLDLMQFDHFTIGYSERSLEQFVELLRLARVNLVADVRRVPVSRFRPDFSKARLCRHLATHNIQYVHWPEMGVPPDIRRSLPTQELLAWYDSNIQPQVKLSAHSTELSNQRVAFMCVEVDPKSCHRHRISTCLEQTGYRLLDL